MDVADRHLRVEKYRDLLARLHALPRRRLTLLVGVDGSRSASTSAFTRALAALDPGLDLVPLEDFGLPAAPAPPAPAGGGGLDWRRLRSDLLAPLSRDQPARYRRYEPGTGRLAEWRMVPVGGIVVVEGSGAFLRPLWTFYDFRVWVGEAAEAVAHFADGDARGPDGATSGTPGAYDTDPVSLAHLRVLGGHPLAQDPLREYVRVR